MTIQGWDRDSHIGMTCHNLARIRFQTPRYGPRTCLHSIRVQAKVVANLHQNSFFSSKTPLLLSLTRFQKSMLGWSLERGNAGARPWDHSEQRAIERISHRFMPRVDVTWHFGSKLEPSSTLIIKIKMDFKKIRKWKVKKLLVSSQSKVKCWSRDRLARVLRVWETKILGKKECRYWDVNDQVSRSATEGKYFTRF